MTKNKNDGTVCIIGTVLNYAPILLWLRWSYFTINDLIVEGEILSAGIHFVLALVVAYLLWVLWPRILMRLWRTVKR